MCCTKHSRTRRFGISNCGVPDSRMLRTAMHSDRRCMNRCGDLKPVVLFCIAAALADMANACSCGGRITVANQFADASIVFVGRVESVRDRWSPLANFWLKVRRFFNEQARPEIDYQRY